MNELVGEDLQACESSYETSIIMLEALLEPTTPNEEQDSLNALDEEDSLTIEKCIPLESEMLTWSHPKYSQTSGCTTKETGFCIPTKLSHPLRKRPRSSPQTKQR